MLTVFVIGVAIAFVTSIPVGPVGFLCVSRSIAHGKWSGFAGALGASVADVFFAVVAAYSLTGVARFMQDHILALHGLGIAAFIAIAAYFLRSKPRVTHARGRHSSVRDIESFLFSAFLAVTNPVALFGFFSLFALTGIAGDLRSGLHAFAAVAGVLVGSCLWWYLLCSLAERFESRMNDRTFRALNRGFGVLMLAFAVFLAYRTLAIFLFPGITLV